MGYELRPLALPVEGALEDALREFDCCGEKHEDDPIAQEVNAFLREGQYALGIEQDLSSTYLFIEERDEDDPALLGYVTLALDSVRLTDSEKKRLNRPDFAAMGAIRVVMIGTQHERQGTGIGTELLLAVVGLARAVSKLVAVRFLVADVNPTKLRWYEHKSFEANRSSKEQERGGDTVSMRLDLRDRG